MVCKLILAPIEVPHFNAGIWTEEKAKIGKVDDVFGQINDVVCSGCRASGFCFLVPPRCSLEESIQRCPSSNGEVPSRDRAWPPFTTRGSPKFGYTMVHQG